MAQESEDYNWDLQNGFLLIPVSIPPIRVSEQPHGLAGTGGLMPEFEEWRPSLGRRNIYIKPISNENSQLSLQTD